jgi:FkbM family methyltransferase
MLFALSKRFAWKVLPGTWLHAVRRRHLLRKFARIDAEPEMDVVCNLVPENGTAIDVGANFGLYTHYLARRVGPRGRVVAFEPMAATYDVLTNNVKRHGLTQVTLHRAAVSDVAGTVTMELPEYAAGGSNFYEARIRNDAEGESVAAVRLDDLLLEERRIDFLKMDVEGHEGPALRGTMQTLRKHCPALMIEVSGNPDVRSSEAARLIESLEALGYQTYRYEAGRLLKRQPGDRAVNLFFLQMQHLRKLPANLLHSST